MKDLIRALENQEPVLFNYYDNGEWTAYNLTETQFEKICGRDDAPDVLDKFILAEGSDSNSMGYVPTSLEEVAKAFGFGVRSE